jgi:drug/metabolite transporter (DMT)-like permease
MTARPQNIGAGLALFSAALFGASTPLAKLLLGSVSPWLLAGLLYLGSGIGLAIVALLRTGLRGTASEAPLRRADMPWLLLVALAGGICGPVLLMIGLTTTPASAASLLLNLEGLFTLLIAWTVFHESVDRRIGIGAAAILLGALIISWDNAGPLAMTWGALAIAGACLAWGIDNNLTRKLSAADPIQIAMIKGLVAGVANIGLALLQGDAWPAATVVANAAMVGFVGYGISLVLFALALRHIGAARTGAYFSSAPFIGALGAILLLNEHLTIELIAAGALMALGLYLHLAERHQHAHTHDELAHEHRHIHDEHHRHAHASGDPADEPHSHPHVHARLVHSHPHYPDLHHRHRH